VASRYRVQWTAHAAADLTAIIRFISLDSPLNARRVYQRIRRRTATRKNFPDRGHVVPELAGLDVVAYRELSLPPYRILYRTEKQTVFVQAVLDGRRDLREVLAERLLR
jgi:plasmid stabilization system protein ParE